MKHNETIPHSDDSSSEEEEESPVTNENNTQKHPVTSEDQDDRNQDPDIYGTPDRIQLGESDSTECSPWSSPVSPPIMTKLRKRRHSGKNKPTVPLKGSEVFLKRVEDTSDFWLKCRVLGKGTKTTKKNEKNPWINWESMTTGERDGAYLKSIDWKYCSEAEGVETIGTYVSESDQIPTESDFQRVRQAFVTFIPQSEWHKPFVLEAKEKEYQNFMNFGAIEDVSDQGQDRITSGWVITEKTEGGRSYAKARLVVHGNQELESVRTDSPTIRKTSLRLQFFLAAQYGWCIKAADMMCFSPGRGVGPGYICFTTIRFKEGRLSLEIKETCLWSG